MLKILVTFFLLFTSAYADTFDIPVSSAGIPNQVFCFKTPMSIADSGQTGIMPPYVAYYTGSNLSLVDGGADVYDVLENWLYRTRIELKHFNPDGSPHNYNTGNSYYSLNIIREDTHSINSMNPNPFPNNNEFIFTCLYDNRSNYAFSPASNYSFDTEDFFWGQHIKDRSPVDTWTRSSDYGITEYYSDTNSINPELSSTSLSGMTERVSVSSDGTEGNNLSYLPSISADGRYVAFTSAADNLVAADSNGMYDIFINDRNTGNTELVSVASDGIQGNEHSSNSQISDNGQFVVFQSTASNLVSDDSNAVSDIFVHDRQANQTERVSIATDGTEGNNLSLFPSISSDGRFVAFYSAASNLTSGDTNEAYDIFVHDRQTEQTECISVTPDGSYGDHSSVSPIISPGGRYVAFRSIAANLVQGDNNEAYDLFVRDRQNGQTLRISEDEGTGGYADYLWRLSFSSNGILAFSSQADNYVSGDTNATFDVFVYDLKTNAFERVSVSSNGLEGNGPAGYPSVSGDGRYIAYNSGSSNLVPADTNGALDIFIHDRETGQTELVSKSVDDAFGNNVSDQVSISGDGRSVAFRSAANNLIIDDTNGTYDVFVYDSGGTIQTYNLSLIIEGIGTVVLNPPEENCITDCTKQYDANTEIELIGWPSGNSVFTGWSGDDCSGIGTCTITMDSDKQVTANFIEKVSYAKRTLSQTRYASINPLDAPPFSQNHDNGFVNSYEDDTLLDDVITHVLYPYQNDETGYNSGEYSGFTWPATGPEEPINELIQVNKTSNDTNDTREPLILIHGWQASCGVCQTGVENRDPSCLAWPRNSNDYDAEDYWDNFIRFFAQSEDLKGRYKLYIYQYPSYKHVTFNGRILGQLLYEIPYIRQWIKDEDNEGISILGHSMGGLVSRAMLEQHGVLKSDDNVNYTQWKPGEKILHKLYTLSTPHHGSAGSIQNWVTGDSIAGKDLTCPGTFDLWWDGYDGAFRDLETARDLGNTEYNTSDPSCSKLLNGPSVDAFGQRSVVSEFDFLYIAMNDTVFGLKDSCWTWAVNNIQYHKKIRHFPNPWLRYLNHLQEQKKDIWKQKYVFYGGYDVSEVVGSKGPLYDDDKMSIGTLAVENNGYVSDAAVPITSMFFENGKIAEEELGKGGFPNKEGLIVSQNSNIQNLYDSPEYYIYVGENNEYPIRLLKDYNHDRMLNGAYAKVPGELVINPDPSVDPIADQLMSENGTCRSSFTSIPEWPRFTTGFRNFYRKDYVNLAKNHIEGTRDIEYFINEVMEVFCASTNSDYAWASNLKYEPLYMLLEAELLGKQLEMSRRKAALQDIIIGLRVLSGQDVGYIEANFDTDKDEIIGFPDVLFFLHQLASD